MHDQYIIAIELHDFFYHHLAISSPNLLLANRPVIQRISLDGSENEELLNDVSRSTVGFDLDIRQVL